MTEPHTKEAVLIIVLGLLQENNSVWRIDFFLIKFSYELIIFLHLSHHQASRLKMKLGCSRLEKDITLGLVAIQLCYLQLINIGEKRNPLINNALLEFFDV